MRRPSASTYGVGFKSGTKGLMVVEDNVAKADSRRMNQVRELPNLIEVARQWTEPVSFIHPTT